MAVTPGNESEQMPGSAIRFLFGWFLLFQAMRVILLASTWSLRDHADATLICKAFFVGSRFDLAVSAWLSSVFVLWRIWRPSPGTIERRVAFGLFAAVSFAAILALIAEVEFFKEFQMRLNALLFQFFTKESANNATIVGMVWHGYPVVRWMLLCFLIWGVFLALMYPNFRIHAGALKTQKHCWPYQILGAVVWIGVVVVIGRGGFRGTPLRWGDAVFSQHTYANRLAENGLFALSDAIRSASKPQKVVAAWKKTIPMSEAIAKVREATLLPGETLVDPSRYPLLRTSMPSSFPLRKRPKNVVVVMMESFSAQFCGATGAEYGATPHFDEIARNGVLFDHAFSAGTHTAQGVVGTLCSFPSLPGYETIMKQQLGQQPFNSLPMILRESGFETVFLYNGLFSWDNKEGFFRNQGIGRFIGRNDFKDPTFIDPDWGVSDHDVFERAQEEFTALASGGKPFLGVILTLSNHAPFNLPKIAGLQPIVGGGDQNQRLNGMHYADWALGQFISKARQSAWFDDTLFVFVGDHAFGIPPNLTEACLLHAHVPLLFYGPGILGDRHEVRHTVASQLDVLPTVIGLLGLRVAHQSFGRDLFSLSPDDPGQAIVKRSASASPVYIRGQDALVGTPGKPSSLHTFHLINHPTASPDETTMNPTKASEMEQRLRAFVATGYHLLENRLFTAGPVQGRAHD